MLFGWRRDTARRPWRISAKLLIASSVVTVIGFSAICINVMLDMRHGEEALARQTLENLATTIETDISRNIEIYDLSLRAVASNMLLPEIWTVSKPIRQLILFDHATTARHFGAIQVLDVDGKLIVDASTLDPLPENRSEEDYFTVHRDRPDVGLFISRPMLHHGAYAIVLSRRISDTDGGFLGVVVGSIRFSYFHELFERLSLGPEDTITVLKRDRTIMMRRPFDLDVIGRNLGERPDWKPDSLIAGGFYAGKGPVDATPRLYVRGGGSNPLFVVAGKPLSAVFELWRKEALRIGAVVLALVLFVLGSTMVLAREIGRRAQAENKLEEMATTDALTGLRNRRKFDAVIDVEWRRAMRQKTPLALLMIDADHFKAYNDTFGHQAGDQVLVGIAICISDSVRRAGDCAARYGGEEFAVLLPDTPEADALTVAETIRRKVQGWSDEGEPSTVSIGIAGLVPSAGMDWTILVSAADKALYAAKAGGRNQSMVANIPKLSLVA
jgi:diguanylate cyclase (GGDEF)-like protein